MSRDAGQRIADVLQAIDRCQRYVGAPDDEGEDLVDMSEDAIEWNLQIIGEATNHLPAEITDAHPEIAWPQIRGLPEPPPIVMHGDAHPIRRLAATAC
ncbi:HepT-like ribonuclease domain-containing protein [Solicola gregarius]|uniref:DUF86 domain-containing protein n=1 Tax=Solicola gregarius TaxID=2908642 RepID=A0AA46TLC3_9ACTN|nr:HepT-like ribonuclease domain-containing protein [Solicola gregarius]UYM07375.1 DUF86 domain-containing protein [Solicola gregarius]